MHSGKRYLINISSINRPILRGAVCKGSNDQESVDFKLVYGNYFEQRDLSTGYTVPIVGPRGHSTRHLAPYSGARWLPQLMA